MAWVPLVLAAAGLLITFQAGVWNIGVEGQIVMGAIGAAWVARSVPGPSVVVIPPHPARGVRCSGRHGLCCRLVANPVPGARDLPAWPCRSLRHRLPCISSSDRGREPELPRPAEPTCSASAPGSRRLVRGGCRRWPSCWRSPRWWRCSSSCETQGSVFACGRWGGTRKFVPPRHPHGSVHRGGVRSVRGTGWSRRNRAGDRLPSQAGSGDFGGYGFLAVLVVLLASFRAVWIAPIALFFAAVQVGSTQLSLRLGIDSSLAGVVQGVLVLAVMIVGGVQVYSAARSGGHRRGEGWWRSSPESSQHRHPLIYAVVGETITEKAGVVNLSLDGSILLSAMTGSPPPQPRTASWWDSSPRWRCRW